MLLCGSHELAGLLNDSASGKIFDGTPGTAPAPAATTHPVVRVRDPVRDRMPFYPNRYPSCEPIRETGEYA